VTSASLALLDHGYHVASAEFPCKILCERLLGTATMASAEERAQAFKNDGNKAFAAHDWVTAIDCYTKAIKLNDEEPTYYSNRAQVCPCVGKLCLLA